MSHGIWVQHIRKTLNSQLCIMYQICTTIKEVITVPHIVQLESSGRSPDNHWKINEFCVEFSGGCPVAVWLDIFPVDFPVDKYRT